MTGIKWETDRYPVCLCVYPKNWIKLGYQWGMCYGYCLVLFIYRFLRHCNAKINHVILCRICYKILGIIQKGSIFLLLLRTKCVIFPVTWRTCLQLLGKQVNVWFTIYFLKDTLMCFNRTCDFTASFCCEDGKLQKC